MSGTNGSGVPITTLAGLASLSDLLPDLPLPGPLPNASTSSSILFHPRVTEEANQVLHSNDPQLSGSLAQVLANTNVDYVVLKDGAQSQGFPNYPLAQAIYHQNPMAFGMQNWNHNNMQQANHVGQQFNNHQMNGGGGGMGMSSGSESGASPATRHSTRHQVQQQQQQEEGNTHIGGNNNTNFKIPKIDLNKMSKEDQDLMQKSLKAFAKEKPAKAEEMGMGGGGYNNFSPRAKNNRNRSKYVELSNSESSDEEDAADGKPKSKFFKHTEKERDDERRRQRDERRRRRREDDHDGEYAPSEEDMALGAGRKRKNDDNNDMMDDGASWLKRRRRDGNGEAASPPPNDMDNFVPRKVSRKIEKKLVPRTQKMDPEALMESSNFKRFNKAMETLFDNAEEVNLAELEENEDSEIPPEILVPKYQATDLANEAAKLKSLEAMDSVPTDRIVKLLSLLQWNIRDGSKVVPISHEDDEDEDSDRLFLELAAERVNRAAECAICAMHIMTSKNMDKRVYIDDVIDKVALFVRFQLQNTIYPSFDPVYKELSKSKEGYSGSMKKKRNQVHAVRDRNVLGLYNKCHEIVTLLAELLQVQLMTDTTVLHLSTLGVAPFFVENIPELQLSALKLVTGVFGKYEKHRKLVLDDILASIARLPSTKRSLRTYRLNKNETIQMLTALVLQLIQCVVILPDRLGLKKDSKKKEPVEVEALDPEDSMDRDVLVNQRYENAMATAYQFLTVFLKKCGSKQEEVDYRPLFENFLQDLLTTVNTPEWPAAELLLSVLGRLLVSKFANKGTEVSLRISSLEYLGMVASRLRKDAVQSKLKLDTIDSIIQCVREAEVDNGEEEDKEIEKLDEEERRSRFLQRVLLDYLTVTGGEEDANAVSSRHFYISQWYRDANAEIRRQKGIDQPKKKKKKKEKKLPTSSRSTRRGGRNAAVSESEESDEDDDDDEDDDATAADEKKNDPSLAEVFRLTEERKDFLLSKILPFGEAPAGKGKKGAAPAPLHNSILTSHIDGTSATLIVKYLSSKRPFFNSFDIYLKQILSVLTESSVQVRSKALKCLASVVQEDPSVLSRDDMQRGVNYSFLDAATMVREAAVDLVGKFILHKQELIDKYYDMLLLRILDTGVSVRKRVIKILKDICLEFPDYHRIPEICVKMIRRINDEEGIRKLVMDVFQNMWFVPVADRRRSDKEDHLLVTKAHNITDVVVACKDTGLEWFEQLLQTLFKPKEDKDDATKVNKEPPKQLVLACQQIVDCLVETVLKAEERTQEGEAQSGQSHRIVACLTTTFLFAKIRPQLLVNHVQTLQPYLNIKCFTQGDYQIISHVARTLELTVPLIEHPSQIFLSQLEEASIKLILQHDKTVVAACLSCLGSVVNNVTKNYKLIGDTFRKYFGHLLMYKKVHQKDPRDERLPKATPFFRRALFTVGLLLRYFDFTLEELYKGLEWGVETKMAVFESIYYFMDHESKDVQNAALQALGYICIRHSDLMMEERLKLRYISILTQAPHHSHHKVQDGILMLQVLTNIETYLVEEEIRMIQLDKTWKEYAEKENLKEMGDVSSGMASTIIQIFLQAILDSFVHPSVQVRHASLKVIQLILGQGLVHPVQIVPYLICMSTDSETRVSHTADRELQEIEKKYPGFIHMKLMLGIRLSYNLQRVLHEKTGGVLRGFRTKEGELPTALNGFLYSCLRSTKSQRRGILNNLLKQFDDMGRSELTMMLYLADNLAYIPYTVIDEPLFIIHHIDINVSVMGSNILQTVKDNLKLPPEYEIRLNKEGKEEYVYDEDLDDDVNSLLSRLPDDLTQLQQVLTSSQGCLLLLVLREHLKDLYGINEAKIQGYSPSESQKIYERPVNRKANAKFNPKATLEILKLGSPVPANQLDEEGRRHLISQYLGFKDLMNKIEKDDDEVDEDGNPVSQGPHLTARDLQNIGMPSLATRSSNAAYTTTTTTNGPVPPTLPPGIQGRPESYNPVIRIQNLPVNSLPASATQHLLPATSSSHYLQQQEDVVMMVGGGEEGSGGGYLDPETGAWVPESPSNHENDKKTSVTPLKINLKDKNAQESHKVPKLTINLGNKYPPDKPKGGESKHAFFEELDKSAREREQRKKKGGGGGGAGAGGAGGKHKKKSKKKKKYQSDSEEEADGSDSDVEYLD